MNDDRRQPDISQRLKEALALESLGPPLRRALEHPRRVEIFLFLAGTSDKKGTNEQELCEAFDMSVRLIEYHLKVLQDASLIASVADEQGLGVAKPSYVVSASL
jgi:DNA-binding transcriptional ArsR family regulator